MVVGVRGYRKCSKPYFLLEPFFGSNVEQSEIAINSIDKYAEAIVDAALEVLK